MLAPTASGSLTPSFNERAAASLLLPLSDWIIVCLSFKVIICGAKKASQAY